MSTDAAASPDALSLFRAQQERIAELTPKFEAAEERVRELLSPLAPPADAHATIRIDERGLVSAVTLERAEGATAESVTAAFSDAAVAARLGGPPLPLEAADALLTLAARGETGPVVTVADDLHQFRVMAQYGAILGVDGTPAWLTQTPVDVIADEVLRIGRKAALASDSFDRFSESEGESRG
ncbi:hypothetical protein ACFZA2_06680 [Microbacterium sp. NPDC007973]|uniref:hypothetical protein n=1 Tax=Microbacterium sp. NPDC007973 TaxID=3364182 RepID=UPI0036EB50DD